MTAKLFCKFGARKGDSFVFEGEALIGRSESAQIRIPHPVISGSHARIFHDPKQKCYIIEDKGSSNGTFVDGIRVRETERLHALNVISFSENLVYFFQDLDAFGLDPETVDVPVRKTSEAETPETDAPPPEEAPSVTQEDPSTTYQYILAVVGMAQRRDIKLVEGENTVGRGLESTIMIDHDQISRKHAVFTLKDKKVYVRDLGSTNGTFLDGERVEGDVLCPAGSKIGLGKVEARLTRVRV